jgi:hypothetical protein
MTLREQILGSKPKLVPVECPAWGCTVHVDGTLPLADRLEVARLAKEDADITVHVVILAARDEAGARLFEADDAEALATKDGATLQKIALAAMKANGWTAKDTEDARGN